MVKVKNANRKWFQFWKPKLVEIGMATAFMSSVFSDSCLKLKGPRPKVFLLSQFTERVRNHDRKWYQVWKPKTIKNPDYNPDPVEFDIVRGNKTHGFKSGTFEDLHKSIKSKP